MFKKDTDYIVKDGKVVIIDEFTGRMMDGRRWSDGLHQAVEAKEGVNIEPENQTLASITFQNYFRMYPKLSGMTGTAMTEAPEFFDIYRMNVVSIPTNVDVLRQDDDDVFYKTMVEKFAAITDDIRAKQEIGQPVLVGTVSIEKSEVLSEYLEKAGIDHKVLNARFHESEAHIVAQAGRMGAVTVSTNMAGRGTDIQLGGNLDFRMQDEHPGFEPGTPEYDAGGERIRGEIAAERQRVLDVGGLFVLGTERHESRRIDNQLRGRSGRQGDPGLSRFYLSLDDDLLRIFGPQTMFSRLMNKNLEDGEAIVSSVDFEGDRDRAEEGRGAQLRHPQAGRRIRRRHERPAQGHLRAARRHHGCGRRQRRHHQHAGRDHGIDRRGELPRRHLSRAMGCRRFEGERRRRVRAAAADRRLDAGRGSRPADHHRTAAAASPTRRWRPRPPNSSPSAGSRSSGRS